MDKKIIDFLIKAKKATYAGKGAEVKSSRPNSHDLLYEDRGLKYIDTYLGGLQFVGEEALWDNNKPSWAMNYCGRVLSEEFEGDFNWFNGVEEIFKNGVKVYECIIHWGLVI